MRTIGKRNRELVERITRTAVDGWKSGYGKASLLKQIEEIVIENLPVELWDIWEGADGEIKSIIRDTIVED